jgi:MFS family permease
MGYNAVFGGLGLVLAPLTTGILNWLSGPQAAFLFVGAVNLVGLAIMAFLPLGDSEPGESEASEGGNGMLAAFLILLVAMMVGGLAYRGSTVILPAYLELKSGGIFEALSGLNGMHLSNNLLATTITALIYVAGMVGQYIGGHVGERFEPRYSYLFFHAVCIPAALLMTFATNFQLVGLATVYFFFLLGMQPIENTLVARLSPRRLHHSAYGLKFILTFGIGALAVKLVQWIDSKWGVEGIFPALAIMSVVIVTTIIILIRQTNPRPANADRWVAEASNPGQAQIS